MPAFFSAAITAAASSAFFASAAFAVAACEVTEKSNAARSGTVVTVPLPVTVMVFFAGVSAARPSRGCAMPAMAEATRSSADRNRMERRRLVMRLIRRRRAESSHGRARLGGVHRRLDECDRLRELDAVPDGGHERVVLFVENDPGSELERMDLHPGHEVQCVGEARQLVPEPARVRRLVDPRRVVVEVDVPAEVRRAERAPDAELERLVPIPNGDLESAPDVEVLAGFASDLAPVRLENARRALLGRQLLPRERRLEGEGRQPAMGLAAARAGPRAAHAAVALPSSPRYGVQRCGIRGAASLMKRTSCGARGGVFSSMPTCSGVRSPFRRLHGAHAVTTFSQIVSPPFDRGTTWSSVRRPLVVPQ